MLRCALLLLTLLLPCALPAANLRLVGDSWPPFVDSRLPGNGLAVELVTTALKRAGFDSSFQQVPWSRALYGVRSGDYDIALSAWYKRPRQRRFWRVDPCPPYFTVLNALDEPESKAAPTKHRSHGLLCSQNSSCSHY